MLPDIQQSVHCCDIAIRLNRICRILKTISKGFCAKGFVDSVIFQDSRIAAKAFTNTSKGIWLSVF